MITFTLHCEQVKQRHTVIKLTLRIKHVNNYEGYSVKQ